MDPPGATRFMTKMQKLHEVLAAVFVGAPGKRDGEGLAGLGAFGHVGGIESKAVFKIGDWNRRGRDRLLPASRIRPG